MATDEFEMSDDYEMDDFDDFMEDGEEPRRPPAGNAREAVEYAVEDVAGGIKDTFTKSELTNNLKTLTTNLAPSALNDEMKKITGIKQVLDNELGGILEENKDKISNITGFIMSKTKEGGLINRLATSLNDKVQNNEFGSGEESAESMASREVASQLDTAMLEINKTELDNIQKFSQQESLNRIYTQLLKQDVFNKNITTVFYRKSLEYQYINLTTSKRLLDATRSGLGKIETALSYVVKNTGLPDIVKQRSMEAVAAEARNRMINSGLDKLVGSDGWVSKIVNKIKSKKENINEAISGIDEGIDSYKSVDEMSELMSEMGGVSKTRMFASTLPGMGAGYLGTYIGEKLANTDRGSAAIESIKNVMNNPSEMLKNLSTKVDGGSNIFTKFIRGRLSNSIGSLADLLEDDAVKTNMMVKSQDLNEAVTLDRKSLITQNEVVPSLLSKILKEVHLIRTGKKEDEVEEVKFDYNARSFSTAKDMTSLFNRKLSKVIDGGGSAKDIATMTKHILKKSGVEYDDKMMGEAKSGMASFMLTGKAFKPTDLGDDFYKHFPKEIADILKVGMENINKSDNKTSSTEKTMLRDSFSKARSNIPNIEEMINYQINSGNTDLLVRNGLLKYDPKIGRYKVDEKKYNEFVKSTLASQQSTGSDYDIKERRGKTFKEDMESLVTGVSDFKANVTTNLTNDNMVFSKSNMPKADSMFTLNKSGSNSIIERLATDAVRGVNIAGNKAYQNKFVKATVDRIVNDVKTASSTVGKVVTNTDMYKNAEKLVTDNKDKFTVDYAKETLTKELGRVKAELASLKEYMTTPVEVETNRLKPMTTKDNKPLDFSQFTLNKSGTNSVAEKLAIDASKASSIAMTKLSESISSLTKSASETKAFKAINKVYDDNKDMLSVEALSNELLNIRTEMSKFKSNIINDTAIETNRLKPLASDINTNKPKLDSMFTMNKSGTNSVAESLVTKGVNAARVKKAQFVDSTKLKNIKARANAYRKALMETEVYSSLNNHLGRSLGITLDSKNIETESDAKVAAKELVPLLEQWESIVNDFDDKAIKAKSIILRKLNGLGLVSKDSVLIANQNLNIKAKNAKEDDEILEKTMTNRVTSKITDLASFISKPFKGNGSIAKEFNNLTGKVTTELVKTKESKRFAKLKTIVNNKLEKLGIPILKKLSNTQVLELMTLMTSSKSIKEVKSTVINYLFINDLINESNLMDHMLHVNNNAPIDEELDTADVTKLSLKDRAMSLFKTATNIELVSNLKRNREENVVTGNAKPLEAEEVVAKKEDSRIKKIVTSVVDALDKRKEDREAKKDSKSKSLDKDNDGVRDGSWMSRVKNKVLGNKPTERIVTKDVTAKEKSSNPMWSIAKVLMMGVPLLISGITSITSIMGTVSKMVSDFPGFMTGALSSLGITVWNAMKWLGGGVFKLGKTIVKGVGKRIFKLGGKVIAGIGAFVLDLGTTIGGFIGPLKDAVVNTLINLKDSIWDGFKWVGDKLLDLGKSIAGAVTGAISGAYNSVKSFFSDAVDEATEVVEDVADAADGKTDGKINGDDKDKKEDKDKKTEDEKDTDGKDKKPKDTKTKSLWSKIKAAGKSVINNPIARKIPVAGAILGGVYGASQLMDGDTMGGLASIGAGILGSIPVVGTGLAYGVDYAVDKYKEWNPDINKQLYNNQTYPTVTQDAADTIILNHIRKYETGKPEGKYNMAGDIDDGAGISFGTYQFTEKSGNLKEYLKRLVAATNDPVGQNYLNLFKGDSVYTGIRSGFLQYLKETGDTQAGRYIQDSMFREIFLDPAKKLGTSRGITNQAAMAQLIDHALNAGLGGAKRMLELANGDLSAEGLARARKIHYTNIIANDPSKEKFKNGWFKRVDGNAAMFMSEISKLAATNPTAITSTVSNNLQPGQPLVGPDGKVVQPQNTPANNAILSTANNMVTAAMQPPSTQPQMQQAPMSNVMSSPMVTQPPMTSIAKMDTGAIETILKANGQALIGIQANTTNMYSNTGALVMTLKTLTETIKALNDTIVANKTSLPNIQNNTKKENNPQVIKAPMGDGISLSKGNSLSK